MREWAQLILLIVCAVGMLGLIGLSIFLGVRDYEGQEQQ